MDSKFQTKRCVRYLAIHLEDNPSLDGCHVATTRHRKRTKKLTKKLGSRPWYGGSDSGGSENGATEATRTDSMSDDDLSSHPTLATQAFNHQDGDTSLPSPIEKEGCQCAICNCFFHDGEPVYQSNNPGCLHLQHQKCMDHWLQFQNTCPTCNVPFVLLNV